MSNFKEVASNIAAALQSLALEASLSNDISHLVLFDQSLRPDVKASLRLPLIPATWRSNHKCETPACNRVVSGKRMRCADCHIKFLNSFIEKQKGNNEGNSVPA